MSKLSRLARHASIATIVAAAATGCAPQLQAVKGESKRDSVSIAFCGAERLVERSSASVWLPGTAVGWGQQQRDTGETEICLSISNQGNAPLVIDRRNIRLIGDSFRGRPLADGQEAQWTIEGEDSESITLVYNTRVLDRGEELALSFKGAISQAGAPVKLAPLRLAYQ